MNKAFNQKGKKSFDDAYPRSRFEFRSLTLRASRNKAHNELQKHASNYQSYMSGSYL